MKRATTHFVLLASLPLLLGTTCTRSDPPPPRAEDAFERATAEIAKDPDSTAATIAMAELQKELAQVSPPGHEAIAKVWLEAEMLSRKRECRPLIKRYLIETIHYSEALAKRRTAIPPPPAVCDTGIKLARNSDTAGKVSAAGFATFAERNDGAALFTSQGGEQYSLRVYQGKPGQIEIDVSDLFKASCPSGSIAIGVTRVGVTGIQGPSPACVAEAEQTYSMRLPECSRDCCNYSSPDECQSLRCNRECAARNLSNPPGHPAIGDACSESGAFYRWCRNECISVASCKLDWCKDDAPQRRLCLDQLMRERDAAIAQCPVTSRCTP